MFTGSKAFTAVLNATHHMLARQAMLLHACSTPLDEDDAARLERHGVKDAALGAVSDGSRIPAWLEKWTSLVLQWTERELKLLPEALVKPNPKQPLFEPYTQKGAEIEAAGVWWYIWLVVDGFVCTCSVLCERLCSTHRCLYPLFKQSNKQQR